MKSRDSATRSVRSPAVKHVCLSLAIAVCLSPAAARPTAALDAAAEFYVRAALALGERDADSLDIYYGPGAWRADARARHLPLDDIRAATVPFIASLDERPSTTPRPRPGGSSSSARPGRSCRGSTSCAVRGRRSRKKCGRCLGSNGGMGRMGPASAADAATARQAGEVLRSRARAVAAGRRRAIGALRGVRPAISDPRDRLAAVFARAVEGCRAATREHVTLPPDERVDVEYVPDLAWSACTRYKGHCHESHSDQYRPCRSPSIAPGSGLPRGVSGPSRDRQSSRCSFWWQAHRVVASGRSSVLSRCCTRQPRRWRLEVAFPGPARLAFERDAAVSPGRSRSV